MKVERNPEFETRLQNIRVGIMGPPGIGKTTLCQILSKRWGAEHAEELYMENPFLEKFYKDPARWSFKAQTRFILDKDKILGSLSGNSSQALIVDPSREMDIIYAKVQHKMGWVNDHEIDLYLSLASQSKEFSQVRDPDVFIAVNAPETVHFERILARQRQYELPMLQKHPEYFRALNRAVDVWVDLNKDIRSIIQINLNEDLNGNSEFRHFVVHNIEGWMSYFIEDKDQ